MAAAAPHIPVLIDPLIEHVSPVRGTWLDGTFGAGGYTRALLEAGAIRVLGVDRDPETFERAAGWAAEYGSALTLCAGEFGDLDEIASAQGLSELDGIVLDIGVSSMQIDQAERGFSFMQDGPLDMRMAQTGPSAADLINGASEAFLADVLFQFGEERASRRIARAILSARSERPITRTLELTKIIETTMPRPKPGQPHPATRSFQALRIAVNDELGQLARGLMAAERILAEGGMLAVVTFHSLEDRIVKRFLRLRSGKQPSGSRFAPEVIKDAPRFELVTRKAVLPDEAEVERNPRARSAKLRVARRLSAAAGMVEPHALGLPRLDLTSGGWA